MSNLLNQLGYWVYTYWPGDRGIQPTLAHAVSFAILAFAVAACLLLFRDKVIESNNRAYEARSKRFPKLWPPYAPNPKYERNFVLVFACMLILFGIIALVPYL